MFCFVVFSDVFVYTVRCQDIFVAYLKKKTEQIGPVGPDAVSGQETAPAQKPSVTVYHEAALRVERQALLRSLFRAFFLLSEYPVRHKKAGWNRNKNRSLTASVINM